MAPSGPIPRVYYMIAVASMESPLYKVCHPPKTIFSLTLIRPAMACWLPLASTALRLAVPCPLLALAPHVPPDDLRHVHMRVLPPVAPPQHGEVSGLTGRQGRLEGQGGVSTARRGGGTCGSEGTSQAVRSPRGPGRRRNSTETGGTCREDGNAIGWSEETCAHG